jgi:hypothetical protein
MRSRILSSLLLATVLAPPAWAQNADDAQQDNETPDETRGNDVVDEPARTPARSGQVTLPPGARPGRESAPETHVVQTGDTLWDLSQRYLGSPWYWPKVWSYNPEIANPHWIYPGNNVRFFPAGEEVPSRVEAGIGPAPSEPESFSDVESAVAEVEVVGKISYTPKGVESVMTQAFVTTRELDEAGRIEGSSSGAELLSYPDVTYVRFKRKVNAHVGEKYVVFHTAQQIIHPVTKRPVGYLTEFVGSVQVTALGDEYVKAQVVETWDAISRGDLVGPYGDRKPEAVVPRRNEKELKGVVLTALVPYQTITGEHYMLVIDKGSADGVQVGNVFTVTRQGDPARQVVLDIRLPGQRSINPKFPHENIALCMVTEVKDRASNCIITRSTQEVGAGDPVIMRLDTEPTAQR